MKSLMSAALLSIIPFCLLLPLFISTTRAIDQDNIDTVTSVDNPLDAEQAGLDNYQTHPEGWGPSTTCVNCHFVTWVDPAKAVGIPLHESTICISEMLKTRDLQWPTAKWDFSLDSQIRVIKETGTTGKLKLKGFLGLNGIKPPFPSHFEGGFFVDKHICVNNVQVTVDCPFNACLNGFREVIGYESPPADDSTASLGNRGQTMD